VGLRHEPRRQLLARLDEDLGSAAGDVVAHRRVRHLAGLVLVHEARQDPAGGVLLLAWCVEVLAQHRVDDWLEALQPS
jgi:hypothetical protein